jgi:hypothetical protein
MNRRSIPWVGLLGVLVLAAPAQAIPAFARKYGTSCTTCHTVYPKLTPFGEAFRRNGFRFPGVDSDYAKQEQIALQPKTPGAEEYGINAVPPLAFGFNGQAVAHPDKNSSGGAADNHAQFTTKDLIAEGHLWTGGTFSDTISYFGEVTFSSGGTVDVEHAQVFASDLIGPKHAVNVRAGRGFSTLTSFGPHSSFLSDQLLPSSGATALNGAGTSWNVFDHFNGIEVNGVVADGRLDYAAGLNAGSSYDTRPSENYYGHVGYKLGGMRLDGEGDSKVKDAMRPWEETAVTLDLWAYRSVNSANFSAAAANDTVWLDSATTVGGHLRVQLDSLELNGGVYHESHNHADVTGSSGSLLQAYGELTYLVQPWFVPGVRVEYTTLTANLPGGDQEAHNWRLMPGIAAAVRPNIKLLLLADIESANGVPAGGWGAVGGAVALASDGTTPSGLELESLSLGVWVAF